MRTMHLGGSALLLAVALGSCAPTERDAPATDAAGTSVAGGGQAGCPVQGVWTLESLTVDGQAEPLDGWQQIKVVLGSHHAWMGQQSGSITLRAAADSLAAYRTRRFGGGPIQVTDSTYTEQLEYFHDPSYVDREFTFSCRVEGDRWYHAGELPLFEAGQESGRIRLEEVWRRIGTAGQPRQ